MIFSFLRRRVRHPLFPQLAAIPARHAHGQPNAVADTFGELARAAARGLRVQRAVFVMTGDGDSLSDGQREKLWNWFQVPVYALQLDRGGCVVAWECEAQNGMHVEAGGVANDCPCGRPGLRLIPAGSRSHAAD